MTKTTVSMDEETCEIRRFPLENVWKPQKLLLRKTETLENIIYDSLCATYEHWLETEYGNKPDPDFVLFLLQRSLKAGVGSAWKKFVAERRQA